MVRQVLLTAGLMLGDEGKGACVDHLARFHGASLVVRYNGGPNNGHTVVLPDGRYHTFRQFSSGTFIPGVRTHLSEHVLINPTGMVLENALLEKMGVHDAFKRTTIEANAVVITPYQRSVNILTEIVRGRNAHGSCGQGGLDQVSGSGYAHEAPQE
jgi:adenylosuccinate synthase